MVNRFLKKLVLGIVASSLFVSGVIPCVPGASSVVYADEASDAEIIAYWETRYSNVSWDGWDEGNLMSVVTLGPYIGNDIDAQIPSLISVNGEPYRVRITKDTFGGLTNGINYASLNRIETITIGDNSSPYAVMTDSNMMGAFGGLPAVSAINLTNVDFSTTTNMASMFQGDANLKYVDFGRVNTYRLTDVSKMFNGCRSMTRLDIDSFSFANVNSFADFLTGTDALTTITAPANNNKEIPLGKTFYKPDGTGVTVLPYDTVAITLTASSTPGPGPTPEGGVNIGEFNVILLNGNTFALDWGPRSDVSRGYTVYWQAANGQLNSMLIASTQRYATIPNLIPGTEYIIWVEALLDSGVTASTLKYRLSVPLNPSPNPTPTPYPNSLIPNSTPRVYRLFNPVNGEHFYTTSVSEVQGLVARKWEYEGIGWSAPKETAVAVFRLYNPVEKYHFYTSNHEERKALVELGWKYEGVCWYSGGAVSGSPVYRMHNPNVPAAAAHHFTTSHNEAKALINKGWEYEGVAWYTI